MQGLGRPGGWEGGLQAPALRGADQPARPTALPWPLRPLSFTIFPQKGTLVSIPLFLIAQERNIDPSYER